MKTLSDPQKIKNLLTRGVEEIIERESIEKSLRSGRQLRIKLGIDPTSPDIHIGRSIPLLKLRDFQELGHKIILIIGDFTGVIGDTSDKDSERPMLSQEQVKKNMEDYIWILVIIGIAIIWGIISWIITTISNSKKYLELKPKLDSLERMTKTHELKIANDTAKLEAESKKKLDEFSQKTKKGWLFKARSPEERKKKIRI